MAGHLNPKILGELTVPDLKSAFVELTQDFVRSRDVERAQPSKQKKILEKRDLVILEIKKRALDGEGLIISLSEHDDPQVRLAVVRLLKNIDRDLAIRVTRELSTLPGVVGFSAERVLERLIQENGT